MAKKKKDQYITPQQREMQELIELKKMRQQAAEHPEQQFEFEKEEPIVPKTFKEKWKNYWYHYKTATWVSLFAGVLVVLLVKDVIFRPKYDLNITASSVYPFSSFNTNMTDDLSVYLQDYDGNGKTLLQYGEITVDYTGQGLVDSQINAISMQKMMAVLAAGDDLLFIMDQQAYDAIQEQGDGESIFADLSLIFPDIDIVQGDKLILNQTALGEKMMISSLEEPVFFCLRALGGSADPKRSKVQDQYDRAKQYLQALLQSEYPEMVIGS